MSLVCIKTADIQDCEAIYDFFINQANYNCVFFLFEVKILYAY